PRPLGYECNFLVARSFVFQAFVVLTQRPRRSQNLSDAICPCSLPFALDACPVYSRAAKKELVMQTSNSRISSVIGQEQSVFRVQAIHPEA
ncbi:MAG TPA: hypothetical protein VK747_20775, partial [Blastocatellia bacterium]|nr:hypothetical protein [Blastocatellia bacterium]